MMLAMYWGLEEHEMKTRPIARFEPEVSHMHGELVIYAAHPGGDLFIRRGDVTLRISPSDRNRIVVTVQPPVHLTPTSVNGLEGFHASRMYEE